MNFATQGPVYLQQLQTRRRKPVKPSTLSIFNSYLRNHVLPSIGDIDLASFNNGALKSFVQTLVDKGLAAKTVGEVAALVRSIVASAVTENGEPLYPVSWNLLFIDLPEVKNQKGATVTPEQLEAALQDRKWSVLYAFLAGSGLRIGEAAAVRIGNINGYSSWDPDASVIHVRTAMWRRQEQMTPKTPAAIREVDLDPRLNELLKKFAGERTGFLFTSNAGTPLHVDSVRERSLTKYSIEGFHSFRRFRITRLRELGTPEDIIRYWVGHAGAGITDRYSKLAANVELRKQWAKRSGLGFDLPEYPAAKRKAA